MSPVLKFLLNFITLVFVLMTVGVVLYVLAIASDTADPPFLAPGTPGPTPTFFIAPTLEGMDGDMGTPEADMATDGEAPADAGDAAPADSQ